MARRAKPKDAAGPQVVNITHAKDTVRLAVTKILKYRNERKEINAAISEERARVKNAGVPPAALDLAIRMKESDPEDRAKHDTGYLLARDALGLKVQADLFEPDEDGDNDGDDDDAAPPRAAASAPDAMSAAH